MVVQVFAGTGMFGSAVLCDAELLWAELGDRLWGFGVGVHGSPFFGCDVAQVGR